MSNLLSIKGRTAFVTGAGQGVGRQVAIYLAEHGAGAIVVNDFHAERAESVAAEVEAAGAKALPLAFDVSDFDAVGAAFAETQTTFGGVDILVNNAGNAGPTDNRTGAARRDKMIGIEHYLTVAATLFVIGIFGLFLNRKNIIIMLMSIELMLLAVNINFVAFSYYLGDLVGQVFTLFVLTVAAAEAAIGLAILVCFFRNRGTIAVEDVNVMKG